MSTEPAGIWLYTFGVDGEAAIQTRERTFFPLEWYTGNGNDVEFVAQFPRRVQWKENNGPHYHCDVCDHDYPLWMTDDDLWYQLPSDLTLACLCLKCFTAILRLVRLNRGAQWAGSNVLWRDGKPYLHGDQPPCDTEAAPGCKKDEL